jgi:hypothetical protein
MVTNASNAERHNPDRDKLISLPSRRRLAFLIAFEY